MENQVKYVKEGCNKRKQFSLVSPSYIGVEKSSDGRLKYRSRVDFRALNAVTKFNSYPLPGLRKQLPYWPVENTFQSSTATQAFGRLIFARRTKRKLRSRSLQAIMNSIVSAMI
jgi:hypothetical protein